MKRVALFFLLATFAMNSLAVRVLFDYRVFHAPGEGPYVEIFTSFEGATFALTPADSGLYQSHAEMTLIVNRNGQIVDFRKVAVDGPFVAANNPSDFLSLERFMLPLGIYDLEVEIRDLGDPSKSPETLYQKIEINNPSTGAFVSDLEFVSAYRKTTDESPFSKSGFDLLPYVSNYFPTNLNSLIFYAELYGTLEAFGEGSAFVSNVCVIDARDNAIENCKKIKREKSAMVVPMLQTLDISDLPTGDYKIRIEIRDRENLLVYMKERNFSRNKIEVDEQSAQALDDAELAGSFVMQFTDAKELYDHILYHIPIASDIDRGTIDTQLKNADLLTLQSFLYTFWKKREHEDPKSAWMKYNESIAVVKANFATRIKPGWQSDRGRVYLQYGKPNTRIQRPSDPDYWPFEIWHYYVTNSDLHNRRFLFYDTNLSGDMELLHSDVPEEIKNFQWKDMVRSRPAALNASDASSQNSSQRTDPRGRDEIENLWYSPY